MSSDPVFTAHEFEFLTKDPTGEPGPWKITSVVTSQEDFDDLLVQVAKYDGYDYKRKQHGGVDVEGLRAVGSIPLVKRGTKTQFAFDRYGVTTDYMSVIVRGRGMDVAKHLLSQSPYLSREIGQA